MEVERRGKPRVRVKFDRTLPAGERWYACTVDAVGTELARSPGGSEQDAETYMDNYRRFGAWKKS